MGFSILTKISDIMGGDYFDKKDREMLQLPFSRMAGRSRSAGTTVKGRKT